MENVKNLPMLMVVGNALSYIIYSLVTSSYSLVTSSHRSGQCEKPADADGCWERSERVHELVHEIFYPVDLHRALLKKTKNQKKACSWPQKSMPK